MLAINKINCLYFALDFYKHVEDLRNCVYAHQIKTDFFHLDSWLHCTDITALRETIERRFIIISILS